MKPGEHPCPIPGCSELIPARLDVCIIHWRKIPGKLKRALTEARKEKSHAHADLLDEAIAIVTKRVSK